MSDHANMTAVSEATQENSTCDDEVKKKESLGVNLSRTATATSHDTQSTHRRSRVLEFGENYSIVKQLFGAAGEGRSSGDADGGERPLRGTTKSHDSLGRSMKIKAPSMMPFLRKLKSNADLVSSQSAITDNRFYGTGAYHKSSFYSIDVEKRKFNMNPQSMFQSFGKIAGRHNSSDGLQEAPSRRRASSVRPSQPIKNIETSKMEFLNDTGLWDSFYRQQMLAKQGSKGFALFNPDVNTQYRTTYDRAVGKRLSEDLGSKEKEETVRKTSTLHTAKVSPEEAVARAVQRYHKKNQERSLRFFLQSAQHRIRQLIFVDVIMPHYRFERLWELWIVLCVLWNAIMLPYHMAFVPEPDDQNKVASEMDNFIDICFIVDLVLNFATAYVDDWGSLVTDRGEIAQFYLSHWFWVDLPATLPFELFVPPSEARAINLVKCIRLIRITKIFKFLERFRYANSARIMRLFASLMLVCHWIGCVWFFIGANTRTPCASWPDVFDPTLHDVLLNGTWVFLDGPYPANQTAYCSWLSVHRLGTDEVQTTSKYLKSVYWAVTTITSVGYGDVVPLTDTETMFTIANMLLGAAIYAMIFSNFVSYIARIDQASTKYSEKMEDIREQMRYLRLPQHIRERVEQYFEYVWLCHKGLLDRDNYFYDELPLPLHLECAEYLHLKMLENNPLFKACSRSFLRGMTLRLKPQLVVPGEYVVNKGDAATAIFFIARGELEVLTDYDGNQVGMLEAGDYFGDIGVLTRSKRTASIRALTFCDLHYLVADDLRELLLVYEEDAEVVSKNALDFVRIFSKAQDDRNKTVSDHALLQRLKTGLREPLAREQTDVSITTIFKDGEAVVAAVETGEDDDDTEALESYKEGIASASKPKRTQIVNPMGGRGSDTGGGTRPKGM